MTDQSMSPERSDAAGSPASRWLAEGLQRRRQGDLDGALACYRRALESPPARAPAHFNIGNVLFDRAQWEAAREAFAQAIEARPDFGAAWLQTARCHVRLGALTQAREAFAAVLRLEPGNFSAWLEAGNLCRQLGLQEQALASYRRAVMADSARWEGQLSLARALEDQGQWDPAAMHYHLALTCGGREPGSARRMHQRMARYRLERGDAARALESLRQALGLLRVEQPVPDADEQADLQIDLGEVLLRLGMDELAHRALERASAARAEDVLTRLAQVSFQANLWKEAQEVLRRNVALHPDSATAHWNLAHAHAEAWQMEEAEEMLRRAEALAPQAGARSMRASIAGRLGDVDTALALYRELGLEDGPRSPMRSSAAMSALYSDTLTAQQVADLHRELFAPLREGARDIGSFANPRDPARRLRLGLLTADLHHQHPVNIFMQPVLERLDRRRFEVFVYHTGITHDQQTQRARSRCDHWVAATHLSDLQLARRIEADGIDLMVELSGHTSHNRMPMLARRVAPVQASFLGYPGSTGVPNIDWMLVDPVVAPEGSEVLFTERLIRLPHTVFCYAPEVDYPYPEYGAECLRRPLTFGSFNNVPKLTPHTVKLWAAVLGAVPGSRLVLKAPSFQDESAVRVFRQRFEREGVDGARLEFRGPVGLTEMMAEYADIDIALDPVPYNGGTTTLQALWMGVPVLVKAGDNFVSRMGASFMTAAGLGDWVAEHDADYLARAVRMAGDRDALLQLKRGLRRRLMTSPAWDIDRYVRDLEAAFVQMWAAHCLALDPAAPGAAQ